MASLNQAEQYIDNDATPAALAYATNPEAHSIGVLCLGWTTTAGTPSVADDNGGTWVLDGVIEDSGSDRAGVWICYDLTGGATTVTATLAGATFCGILHEFENGGTPGFADDSASDIGGSSGGLVIPDAAGRLLFGYVYYGVGSGPTGGDATQINPGTSTEDGNNDSTSPGGVGSCHLQVAAADTYTTTGTGGGGEAGCFIVSILLSGAALEQTAFQFNNDDGDENGATHIGSENADISRDVSVNTRVRIQVDTDGDAASQGYQLEVSHEGGDYAKVQLAATTEVPPNIVTADATESGSNTAQSSWVVSRPTLVTGDLIILIIGWDDSTATTSATPAAGPNAEAWTQITGGPVASSSTEVRASVWWTVATGTWTAGSITVTPSATEQWTACVIKVPAGEFDATPIGDQEVRASGGDETEALSPAMTLGATDGGGTLVWVACVDTDPLTTLEAGWTQVTNTDRGAVALGVATRDAVTEDSESVAGGDTWAIAGDTWCSLAFVVRGIVVQNPFYITASANIAAAAADATTAQLSVPNAHSFTAGKISDDTNPVTVDIAEDRYTELEWNGIINPSGVSNTDTLDFRVTVAGAEFGTYTEVPRITVDTGGGGGATIPIIMPHYMKLGAV